MSVHTFVVELNNGEIFTRAEWGRSEAEARATLWDCYGENLKKAVKKI